ncbi:predicted protein [Uncinocarpus reesii 1704]|uniref:BTB domain-containing protein n=1 Tax=Uncinocarpus reesii (strain UAMH 1704) TaxID=336963 RepID=C4JIB7_UNCRE|nr:uncharacterized protein UREG_02863 [Uncinocarpus reesii 1704]EEP78014.1 predicted protein [Uncinocarpus reesii 1704]
MDGRVSGSNSQATTLSSGVADIPCTVIAQGDLVLNCVSAARSPSGKRVISRFRTSSAILRKSCDYFQVLLDPTKFQEGRTFLESKKRLEARYGSVESALYQAKIDELPEFTLELPPLSPKVTRHALLCDFFALLATAEDDDPASGQALYEDIAKRPIFFLASLVALLDRYGALHLFKRAMSIENTDDGPCVMPERRRLRDRLRTFRSHEEERLREVVFLAYSIHDQKAFAFLTHRLVVDGSRMWRRIVDEGQSGIPIWWQLPGVIEQELEFRNQCILDTISDYQSHLLCAFGASTTTSKQKTTSLPSTKRELQCRRVYENSRACDSFHLGEMIHFFSTRAKTLELQSTLSNHEPDYDAGYTTENEFDDSNKPGSTHARPDAASAAVSLACLTAYKDSRKVVKPSEYVYSTIPNLVCEGHGITTRSATRKACQFVAALYNQLPALIQ